MHPCNKSPPAIAAPIAAAIATTTAGVRSYESEPLSAEPL